MSRKERKTVNQSAIATSQLIPKTNKCVTKSRTQTKMTKLSFRTKALDPSKPMNIHIADELPNLIKYSALNRAVPQMPSGMEKGEESVRHLFVVVMCHKLKIVDVDFNYK